MVVENAKTTISPLGVFLIILSLVGVGFFTWQITKNVTEIDAESVGEEMVSAAEDMSKLRSYSGSSVAEYFYRHQGEYLEGEAKIHNAEVRIQQRTAIGTDVIGILACIGLLIVGTKLKTTKIIAPRKESRPRYRTSSSDKAPKVITSKPQTNTATSHTEDQFDEDL